jgi:hypothetical protein
MSFLNEMSLFTSRDNEFNNNDNEFNNEFNDNGFNNNDFNDNEFNNNEFNNNEFSNVNNSEFDDDDDIQILCSTSSPPQLPFSPSTSTPTSSSISTLTSTTTVRRPQHFIRQYLKKLENDSVECIFCKTRFGKTTGISSIKRYFERYHKKVYQQQYQTTLDFPISNPYKKDDLKLKKINNKLIKWVIFDQQPFDVVEDKCFIDLVAELDSRYKLPCRQTISSWIESIFKKQKIDIKKKFSDFSHKVSLTTDAWTSTTTNQGYLGVTAHWIDDSWRMKKILLDFIPLNENHTGVYLANKILDTLEEFSLGKKVLAMTTDNGANMVNLAEHLNSYLIQKYDNRDFMHLRCGAHVLNLAVKEGIKLIDQPIEKLRKIASTIRNSQPILEELKTIFEMKNQNFLIPDLDITTRWNSLYNMIKKMLRIKDMVDILVAGNKTLLQIYPDEEEWINIEVCENIFLYQIFFALFIFQLDIYSGNLVVVSNIGNI